jgi:hypothetical protein
MLSNRDKKKKKEFLNSKLSEGQTDISILMANRKGLLLLERWQINSCKAKANNSSPQHLIET